MNVQQIMIAQIIVQTRMGLICVHVQLAFNYNQIKGLVKVKKRDFIIFSSSFDLIFSNTQGCSFNTYGQNCSLKCNCLNSVSCDPVSGFCTCQPGWSGSNCSILITTPSTISTNTTAILNNTSNTSVLTTLSSSVSLKSSTTPISNITSCNCLNSTNCSPQQNCACRKYFSLINGTCIFQEPSNPKIIVIKFKNL
jgi:hypothetical protein